jgi:hypothetical protein
MLPPVAVKLPLSLYAPNPNNRILRRPMLSSITSYIMLALLSSRPRMMISLVPISTLHGRMKVMVITLISSPFLPLIMSPPMPRLLLSISVPVPVTLVLAACDAAHRHMAAVMVLTILLRHYLSVLTRPSRFMITTIWEQRLYKLLRANRI